MINDIPWACPTNLKEIVWNKPFIIVGSGTQLHLTACLLWSFLQVTNISVSVLRPPNFQINFASRTEASSKFQGFQGGAVNPGQAFKYLQFLSLSQECMHDSKNNFLSAGVAKPIEVPRSHLVSLKGSVTDREVKKRHSSCCFVSVWICLCPKPDTSVF